MAFFGGTKQMGKGETLHLVEGGFQTSLLIFTKLHRDSSAKKGGDISYLFILTWR